MTEEPNPVDDVSKLRASGRNEEGKPADDVSRLRAAAAEAAERRAAEAKAAQGQALPPADEGKVATGWKML